MNDKDISIANRILVAGTSVIFSTVFWLYILDFLNTDGVIGPNIKVLIGMTIISVIATDRLYVKFKQKNF